MNQRKQIARSNAFTLLELLVVITVIAILAALALPMLGRVQTKGLETKTLSNIRQMGTALMAYAGDNSYQIPGREVPKDGVTADKWPLVLKPYIQDLTAYGCPIPDVGGKSYHVKDPNLYLSNSTNYTSYIYNGGNDAVSDPGGALTSPQTLPRLNVIPMSSKTILLGVPMPQANNFYMDFVEKNNSTILNKNAFGDGSPYVFADGSARFLAVDSKASNTKEPESSATYTDWLWLFDKSQTALIH